MNWSTKGSRRLIEAVLSLKTPDEARRFLRDLMTEGELEEFARRLEAAELLAAHTPYEIIVEKTGLSSTTVARVSRWLNGTEGGYRTVLNRLHHNNPVQSGRGLS